jgi:diguanylate cyclase (GGDEF)-like protein/PAS domain S-box-containing protein
MSEVVKEPGLDEGEHGVDILDRMLACAADVTILIDVRNGTTIRRWYDPDLSRLQLGEAEPRAIHWVHPDDLPAVLEMLASVTRDGGSQTTAARLHPDREVVADGSLVVSAHDLQEVVEGGLLVQAWLVDVDRSSLAESDPTGAMTSLAAAVPVGLQMRSANGSVTFENERFTALATIDRTQIDELVTSRLELTDELVRDLDIDGCSLRLHVVPQLDDLGRPVLLISSLEDVTGLRIAEQARAAAEGLFRAVFDGSPAATAIVEPDGRLAQVNEALAMILGYTADELIGRTFAEITHPNDLAVDQELLAEVLAGTRSGYQMEKRYLHRSGHEVWADLTVATVRRPDGEISHLVSTVEDITARKTLLGTTDTGELAYWASHDHLTGLPNRRYLDTYLDSAPQARRRASDRLVVLFLDLDDFKPVNDVHGHAVGDEVLRTIARRLRNTSRQDKLVARYGGDEFVVVTHHLRTAPDVSLTAERILAAVRTPIVGLVQGPIVVGASVGIGIAAEGDDPADVLRRADMAAARAKRDGKNRACTDPGR